MTLTIWTNLFLFVMAYQIVYLFSLVIKPNQREEMQEKNLELETLRKVAVKSLDQQKRFLELKFTKAKSKKHWTANLSESLTIIVLVIVLMLIFQWLFNHLERNIPPWLAVLCIFIVPFTINVFLRRSGMNRPSVFDVIHLLRPKRTKGRKT
jgi:hypothetical protein